MEHVEVISAYSCVGDDGQTIVVPGSTLRHTISLLMVLTRP